MALRSVYWVALAICTASYAADWGRCSNKPARHLDPRRPARPRAFPDLRRAWYRVRVDSGDAQAGAVGGPRHAFRNHGDPPSAQSGVVRADGAAPESGGRQELEPTVSR